MWKKRGNVGRERRRERLSLQLETKATYALQSFGSDNLIKMTPQSYPHMCVCDAGVIPEPMKADKVIAI